MDTKKLILVCQPNTSTFHEISHFELYLTPSEEGKVRGKKLSLQQFLRFLPGLIELTRDWGRNLSRDWKETNQPIGLTTQWWVCGCRRNSWPQGEPEQSEDVQHLGWGRQTRWRSSHVYCINIEVRQGCQTFNNCSCDPEWVTRKGIRSLNLTWAFKVVGDKLRELFHPVAISRS